MPYEFDIVETSHTVDHTAEERGLRDSSWSPLTQPMDEHSRQGWELVDVNVHIVAVQNKYGRSQKLRTVISVWRRPVSETAPTAPAKPTGPLLDLDAGA